MSKEYHIIGIMSGTSLDGLDIVHCTFHMNNDFYSFTSNASMHFPYPENLKEQLSKAHLFSGSELAELDIYFAKHMAHKINEFVKIHSLKVDFISSHGHTVFHQPEKGITVQIGNGSVICAETKTTTISDFRSLDVALSGQGAPLVPVGDLYLFPEYTYCLNLGGISNISIKTTASIQAYDICPCNMAFNYFANLLGSGYDKDGLMAESGKLIPQLLDDLNDLEFFHQSPPKSLGREWFESSYLPVIDKYNIPIEDRLRTILENVAIQISKQLDGIPDHEMLITGGGAHNSFLISRIDAATKNRMVIPSKEIIDFKEAIIFAFLGLLRVLKKVNVLKSVTGGQKDSTGGVIHYYS